MPTYIDVHVLQTVPPSNINRDDAGSPKQAVYGGTRRSRVSSQAWKRASRSLLAEGVPATDQATRTKRISTVLAERLIAHNSELSHEQAIRLATALLKPLGITGGKKETDTAYLLFFGRAQLDGIVAAVADRAVELSELDEKELLAEIGDISIKDELMKGHPLDVALFGRMVADLPAINVDAATQVAHAISTHSIDLEFDYFTAVDDEKDTRDHDDAGAAMIGTIEFNSSTLYRYATVGLDQLIENMGSADGLVVDGVSRFVDAFVRSMPTGHQNSFAHRTLPAVVMVAVRTDQPVNLVSAFEKPVRSSGGFAAPSAQRLALEHVQVSEQWGTPANLVVASYSDSLRDDAAELSSPGSNNGDILGSAFGPSRTHAELLAAVREAVSERLTSGEG